MPNVLAPRLSVLVACVTVGAISVFREYQAHRLVEAAASGVIWFVITPLFGLWWEHHLALKRNHLKYRLLVAVPFYVVVVLVLLARASRAGWPGDTWVPLLIWVVALPAWVVWSFRRNQRGLKHTEPRGERPSGGEV